MTLLMQGKKGLIMGAANESSLAWGIASQLAIQGADLAFTYAGDAIKRRLEPLSASLGSQELFPCDVSKDEDIKNLFQALQEKWGSLDFVVHAIAFSKRDELKGRYVDTGRENFLQTMDISCYSFTAVAHAAAPLMTRGGSILTLSYHGAQRVMPHYNVMGVAKAALEMSVRYLAVDLGRDNIRVNALSAGPARTLSSSAIGDFHYIMKWNQYNSPLKRNVTLKDIGGAAVYLLSDLASGVTGEVHYVDAGYNVIGMKAVDAPDIATV